MNSSQIISALVENAKNVSNLLSQHTNHSQSDHPHWQPHERIAAVSTCLAILAFLSAGCALLYFLNKCCSNESKQSLSQTKGPNDSDDIDDEEQALDVLHTSASYGANASSPRMTAQTSKTSPASDSDRMKHQRLSFTKRPITEKQATQLDERVLSPRANKSSLSK